MAAGLDRIRRFVHSRKTGREAGGDERGYDHFQEAAPARGCRKKVRRCRNSPKCPNAGPKGVSEECKQ
jgi:hypothetical protein